MASYEQVVKFEGEKPAGVIRLVEANGFYRAYEKSAFLFHQVIAQHKVTRKFVKNIRREVVYVGFPVDKLVERIGGRSHKKTRIAGVRRRWSTARLAFFRITPAIGCVRCWWRKAGSANSVGCRKTASGSIPAHWNGLAGGRRGFLR